MKSIIKGFNYPKIFTKGIYSSREIEPIKKICNLPFGWKLYHVVKPKRLYGILYDPVMIRQLELLCNVTSEDIVSEELEATGEKPIIMCTCRSKIDNGYIGTPETAWRLFKSVGLTQIQKADTKHKTCSIGFNEKTKKWYGWSHRAMHGFGIGDSVKKGDCTNSSGFIESYLKCHPEEDRSLPVGFKANTLEDAKRMAIAFAESVS